MGGAGSVVEVCLLAVVFLAHMIARMGRKCDGWCPLCYAALKGRQVRRGHWGWRPTARRKGAWHVTYLRKRGSSSSKSDGSGGCAAPADEQERWAALLEHLSASAYPTGEERETGTILLFAEGGRLKACVSDRDQNAVAFVTGSGLLSLLSSVEDGLRDDTLDWRGQKKRQR